VNRRPSTHLALALLSWLTTAVAAETAPPTLRLPDGVRPTAHAARLEIDPARESFDGRVEIALELARPTRVVWLNAERLELAKATFESGGEAIDAAIVPGGEQFAGFDAGRELPAGPARLVVEYRGKLDSLETEGLFRQQVEDDWYVYSQFEATWARRAFPCFDEPSFRTPWTLTLVVPERDLAVANTAPVAERALGDGRREVTFAPTPAISSYLVALGVGPFAVVDAGTWGRAKTPVRVIVPRGREARTAWAVEVTGELLARLEEYFDRPHPFGKLDNLGIPQTVGFGAMENPGLVTYSESLIVLDPAAAPLARKRIYAFVAAHENAHQWFGNLVTMAWWDDIWLNEGFADWIADKIVAGWRPDWFTAADRALRRSEAVRADSLPSSRKVRRPIATLDDVVTAFDGISYTKGAALLEMFEAWAGPDRFRAGIRRYVGEHAWGNATSDDFLAALAAESDPQLAAAFASFLDQPGAPVVTFTADCPEGGPAALVLAQRRYVPLGAAIAPGQTWRIPVRLRYGAGDRVAETRTLLSEAAGRVPLEFCPQWLSGNAEGIGYYLSEYRGSLLASLSARGAELPDAEQIALLDDVSFLVSSGDLAPGEALALLPRFAGSPYRRVTESAAEIAESVDAHLVPDRLRPNYERFLAGLFAERARALGLAPRSGESEDEALLRPGLVRLMAIEGDDRALRAEARRLADRWFEDRAAVAPDMLSTVLALAARDGDAALFVRLVAAAAAEEDTRLRGTLLGALGHFREPALVDRALALVLADDFDVRETGTLVYALAFDRATRDRVFPWMRSNYDALAGKLPAQWVAALPYLALGACDEAARAEADAFFRPKAAALPGGEILLARALDALDVCVARRAKQADAVAAFLEGY
jgi:alanyl aminopeptidase